MPDPAEVALQVGDECPSITGFDHGRAVMIIQDALEDHREEVLHDAAEVAKAMALEGCSPKEIERALLPHDHAPEEES